MSWEIREITESYLSEIKKFSDQYIAPDYFSMDEYAGLYRKSFDKGLCCSFVLIKGDEIGGIRISLAPGLWSRGKGRGLMTEHWPHRLSETAYFQTILLKPELRGLGFAKKLSQTSIEAFKKMGAKGIACHSWQESPNNSSSRYLKSFGFFDIALRNNYWEDWPCEICSEKCGCTAMEMYLDLEVFPKDQV